jgi:hypothetical protein
VIVWGRALVVIDRFAEEGLGSGYEIYRRNELLQAATYHGSGHQLSRPAGLVCTGARCGRAAIPLPRNHFESTTMDAFTGDNCLVPNIDYSGSITIR